MIKGSERKKLRTYLGNQFPQLSPEDLSALVSNKDEMQQSKLYTHSGQSVTLYIKGGNPVFFEIENEVFPTVYTLWAFPDLMASFTTWPPVFEKLSGGADLMLPGVILQDDNSIDEKLANVRQGQICSVKLLGNKSPVGIGKSLISAKELFGLDRKGKALNLLHTYGDQLWASGDRSTLPLLEESVNSSQQIGNLDQATNNAEDPQNSSHLPDISLLNIQESETSNINTTNGDLAQQQIQNVEEVEDTRTLAEIMDHLLLNCLLTSFKTTMKKIELPLLVSTFHKSHLLPSCPANQQVDVKKSSYKKLSVFLKEMQKLRLLEVKELQKGVESIVSANLNHELVQRFRFDKSTIPVKEEVVTVSKPEYAPPQIQELYTVSAAVQPIFNTEKIGKGAALSASQVRQFLTSYVKKENIQKIDDPSSVTLDPILAHSILNRNEYIDHLKWEELYSRCFAKMSNAYEVKLSDNRKITGKGTIPPIEITTAQRSGNKKVTLVYNLEIYGIEPEKFAHEVQVGVAASTSVSQAASKRCTQVLIQGNQTKFVGKLLIETYLIPKKYIIGLDKHASSKKK